MRGHKAIDLTGRRYGQVIVVRRAANIGRRVAWVCRCDCGGEFTPRASSLTTGNTLSCGCRRGHNLRTHGLSRRLEYGIWGTAKQRCFNPADPAYAHYGGRGITMCEEWRDDFTAFYRDMGPRPSAMHSIDRIDNAGPYAPGNCRWVTMKEQNRNRRGNRLISAFGQVMTATDWGLKYGLHPWLICKRMARGLDAETALTLKRQKGGHNLLVRAAKHRLGPRHQ